MPNSILLKKIENFLSTRIENNSNSMTDVESSDLKELNELFSEIVDTKWERDIDGYQSVSYELINRNKYQLCNWSKVPLIYDLDVDNAAHHIKVAQSNLKLATDNMYNVNHRVISIFDEASEARDFNKKLSKDGVKIHSNVLLGDVACYIMRAKENKKGQIVYELYRKYPKGHTGVVLLSNDMGKFKIDEITVLDTEEKKELFKERAQANVDMVIPFYEKDMGIYFNDNAILISFMIKLRLNMEHFMATFVFSNFDYHQPLNDLNKKEIYALRTKISIAYRAEQKR